MGLGANLLLGQGFTLHARRLQVPSTEYAASGLGIGDASVRDAGVVGAELHIDLTERLDDGLVPT